MDDHLARAAELLKATHAIIKKSHENPFEQCVTTMTVTYDDAECDGHCLATDIENWFLERDEPIADPI